MYPPKASVLPPHPLQLDIPAMAIDHNATLHDLTTAIYENIRVKNRDQSKEIFYEKIVYF